METPNRELLGHFRKLGEDRIRHPTLQDAVELEAGLGRYPALTVADALAVPLRQLDHPEPKPIGPTQGTPDEEVTAGGPPGCSGGIPTALPRPLRPLSSVGKREEETHVI